MHRLMNTQCNLASSAGQLACEEQQKAASVAACSSLGHHRRRVVDQEARRLVLCQGLVVGNDQISTGAAGTATLIVPRSLACCSNAAHLLAPE